MGTPRSSPWPLASTSNARPRVNDVRMLRISASTKPFFFMFARHNRSGIPVVADCARANSSGVWVPSPIGRVAFMYSSPARPTRAMSSSMGISRRTSRARWALRMSRWISPPLARLTRAIGSPVAKCTTSSTSRLS